MVGVLHGTGMGPGTVTALRADMDALPIEEKTGLVPARVNDPETSRMVSDAAEVVLGQGCVERLPGPVMGSEDFASYLEQAPRGALFRVGLRRAGREVRPLHNSGFGFNDEALSAGASVLAGFVLRFHGSQNPAT